MKKSEFSGDNQSKECLKLKKKKKPFLEWQKSKGQLELDSETNGRIRSIVRDMSQV